MPFDVIKTRLQAQSSRALGNGTMVPYRGAVDCFTRIVEEEGAVALWNGVTPALGRVAAMFGSSLATYDTSKALWEGHFGSGSTRAHILSSVCFLPLSVACLFVPRLQATVISPLKTHTKMSR